MHTRRVRFQVIWKPRCLPRQLPHPPHMHARPTGMGVPGEGPGLAQRTPAPGAIRHVVGAGRGGAQQVPGEKRRANAIYWCQVQYSHFFFFLFALRFGCALRDNNFNDPRFFQLADHLGTREAFHFRRQVPSDVRFHLRENADDVCVGTWRNTVPTRGQTYLYLPSPDARTWV